MAIKPHTSTSTSSSTKTKEKPEVKTDTHLFKLFQLERDAREKAASYMIEICEYIEKENLSNATIIKTMMDARGIAQASAASQVSRIRNILNDQTTLEKLRSGDVTIRAAVQRTTKSQIKAGPKNKEKAFDRSLSNFIQAAKALGQPKKTILITVEAALDEAKIK